MYLHVVLIVIDTNRAKRLAILVSFLSFYFYLSFPSFPTSPFKQVRARFTFLKFYFITNGCQHCATGCSGRKYGRGRTSFRARIHHGHYYFNYFFRLGNFGQGHVEEIFTPHRYRSLSFRAIRYPISSSHGLIPRYFLFLAFTSNLWWKAITII